MYSPPRIRNRHHDCRAQVQSRLTSVDASLPLNQNLYLLLRQHFPADPDTAWLVLPDGHSLPYGDIEPTTACYAGALHSLGIGHGDRVLAQIDKSPEALLLYLATLRLGAIYVPLNTAYTPTEVAYFLGDARPGLFIAQPDCETTLSEVAQATATTLLTLDGSGQGSLRERVDQATPLEAVTTVSGDEIATIIYTSGTTGRSKGAMLSHNNLASNALALRTLWGFVSTDVLLHALPIYHLHGLFVAVHCAMLRGIPMLFLPRFDPGQVMTHLRSATVMMGVPTFYTRLLQTEGFDRASCEHMRLFISGSAPLLAQTWQAFYEHTGHHILERYGMSEAGMIASNPLTGERLPGTVGFALPGITLRVCDNTHHPLPAGQTGVLEMRGPNVFQGYWQMPEKTASEFTNDGFFISGDLATLTDDGRVSIVGREKDLVISGGLNVYPKEIEEAINALPGINETAVIGVPHADLGEGLVAVVCITPGDTLDADGVIETLKASLAGFKVPRQIYSVDELPRNTMGKVQKNILRERYAETFCA